MLVMKVKGAVLQDRDALIKVKNMLENQDKACVVVSALKGVMPRLRQLYDLSLRKGAGFGNELEELKRVHEQLACQLLAGKQLEAYQNDLREQLEDLHNILHHVAVLRDTSYSMKDYILSKGDFLASLLFCRLFDSAEWHDSRNFILTDNNFGAPEVLWEESCRAAVQEFRSLRGIAVVPGYCGKTNAGYTISLGRVGLSLTASVLEAAFQREA